MAKPSENSSCDEAPGTFLHGRAVPLLIAGAALVVAACGASSDDSGPSGMTTATGSGGVVGASGGLANSGGGPGNASGGLTSSSGANTSFGGATSSGGAGAGAASASGGKGPDTGGASGGTGSPTTGGATSATGGSGGASAPNGGSTAVGGAGTSSANCKVGSWPTANPEAKGPYETVTENEVGPEAGAAEDGVVPKFTLFRPKELNPGGLCHPVITWGNGTGSTPNLYGSLLNLFASHGFIVIASNSKNVAQGNPRPMLVGVDWILEQNADPSSPLYGRIDTTHIGATGHSQGAVATSQASGDSRITTNIPIEGAMVQRNLHGPSMFFCGGMDDVVPCDGAMNALNAVSTLPAMYAEFIAADHGSWMSRGSTPGPVYAAVTAWMRVHSMGDESLRSWFYGASCKLCTDSAWNIEQKNMD